MSQTSAFWLKCIQLFNWILSNDLFNHRFWISLTKIKLILNICGISSGLFSLFMFYFVIFFHLVFLVISINFFCDPFWSSFSFSLSFLHLTRSTCSRQFNISICQNTPIIIASTHALLAYKRATLSCSSPLKSNFAHLPSRCDQSRFLLQFRTILPLFS